MLTSAPQHCANERGEAPGGTTWQAAIGRRPRRGASHVHGPSPGHATARHSPPRADAGPAHWHAHGRGSAPAEARGGARWLPRHTGRMGTPPPRLDTWRRRERPPPRSVAWADWFGRFFPFSTRFSHGSTDSAPVQAPRARFSPGFLLHRLRHLPLHATVLWEGQLRLRKEGGPPLSQVSPL
jgi:hypothetical protein